MNMKKIGLNLLTVALIFQSLYIIIFDGTAIFLLLTLSLLLLQNSNKSKTLLFLTTICVLIMCYFQFFWLSICLIFGYFFTHKFPTKLGILILLIAVAFFQSSYQKNLRTQNNTSETWQQYGAL